MQMTFSGENKIGGSTSETAYVGVSDDELNIYYKDSKYYDSFSFCMSSAAAGSYDVEDTYDKPVSLDSSFISEHIDD